MLEYVDLTQKIEKSKYKPAIKKLEQQLGALQREAKNHKIPMIFLFEGWDAAGKGTLINRLALALDPRGFKVYPVLPPNEEESLRPFLWRFWIKLPEKGEMCIFDRSWSGRLIEQRVEKAIKGDVLLQAYNEINSFERQLSNNLLNSEPSSLGLLQGNRTLNQLFVVFRSARIARSEQYPGK